MTDRVAQAACGTHTHTLVALNTHNHAQVVKRLLRPAAKITTNPWETFMLSASSGDVKGCWLVVSGKAALLSAPVVLGSLATHPATGVSEGGVAAAAVSFSRGSVCVCGSRHTSPTHRCRSLACCAAGHGLPGAVGGGVTEAVAAVLLALGVTTEVLKFAQGMEVRRWRG